MDPSQLPKGQSSERSGDGRFVNLPGIYEHKESGTQIITSEGAEGVVQADALMAPKWNGGWQRVGDVPTREKLLEMRKAQEEKDAPAKVEAK